MSEKNAKIVILDKTDIFCISKEQLIMKPDISKEQSVVQWVMK